MTFVQLPALVDRDPHEAGLFQDMPQGANGTLEERRVGHVGDQALLLDELTRLDDFFVAFGGQGTIVPSSKLWNVKKRGLV